MPRKQAQIALLAGILASAVGCARYVTLEPNGGVVAIPSNTNMWPLCYRDKADTLMLQRCPQGYEICHEEEVDELVAGAPERMRVGGIPYVTRFLIGVGAAPDNFVERTPYTRHKEWRMRFRGIGETAQQSDIAQGDKLATQLETTCRLP